MTHKGDYFSCDGSTRRIVYPCVVFILFDSVPEGDEALNLATYK